MLAKYCGFVCVNNTGQTVTYNSNGRLNLKITGVYVNPTTGKLAYEPLSDDDLGFGAGDSTVDGGEDPSTEIDNSINKYVGFQVQMEVTHDEGAAADGTYDVYYEGGDASGELPSDASGYDDAETNELLFVGSLKWHSSANDDEIIRSNVLAV